MKVAITGGHIAPAIAVIQHLPKDTEVLFIGRKHPFEGDLATSYEYDQITRMNLPFIDLSTGRLQRSFTKETLPSLLKIPGGVAKAYTILKTHRPDIVLGFGGYLSLPVIVAASFLRIPQVIHEQTLASGAANKIASHFATKICISWEESYPFFPSEKTILTGIPLRKEIQQAATKSKDRGSIPLIYVTGGSGGSHVINLLVENNLEKLLSFSLIIHQTGDAKAFNDYDRLQARKRELPEPIQKKYHIEKFLDAESATSALQKADLVVGRSGINTISELLYLKKPSVLIPLPFGQRGEQEKNARFLQALGLAEVLLQENANDQAFVERIQQMISSLPKYTLRDKTLKTRIAHAADAVIAVVHDVEKQTANKNT